MNTDGYGRIRTDGTSSRWMRTRTRSSSADDDGKR